jgi:hypothetical protein
MNPTFRELVRRFSFNLICRWRDPTTTALFQPVFLLRATKIIPKAGRAPSLIGPVLAYVLGIPRTQYDWQRFFGPDHAAAEQIAIKAKQRFETDIDACAVSFDSFCDAAMRKIYQKRGLTMPAYGGAVGGSSPAWLRALPTLIERRVLRIASATDQILHSPPGPYENGNG